MDGVFGVRMAGPLAPYGPGFAVGLTRLGYTRLSARGQLAMVAHLSGWLVRASTSRRCRGRWWGRSWPLVGLSAVGPA